MMIVPFLAAVAVAKPLVARALLDLRRRLTDRDESPTPIAPSSICTRAYQPKHLQVHRPEQVIEAPGIDYIRRVFILILHADWDGAYSASKMAGGWVATLSTRLMDPSKRLSTARRGRADHCGGDGRLPQAYHPSPTT